jgi:lambda repressor-like predicted transcriptional regulator
VPHNFDKKTGRPSTSTDDDHVEKVHAAIHENRRLTVREVSEEVGISKSSYHTILDAKFVPHLLTDELKANHN